jgi:hypothetical protein
MTTKNKVPKYSYIRFKLFCSRILWVSWNTGLYYKSITICNLQMKSQRLQGGNEMNYENRK